MIIKPTKHKILYDSADSDDNFWTIFVDVMMSAFMVSIFAMVYHFFASESNLELMQIRAKQHAFLSAFEKEFEPEILEGKISNNIDGNIQHLMFGDELLFNTGEDTLKANGKKILQRCLKVFNTIGNEGNLYDEIQVQGHTDSAVIKKNTTLWKRGIYDNWDLSAKRANNVVRYFIKHSKIPPGLFSGSSYSWYQWDKRKNIDPSLNRKVEILLMYSTQN